MGNEKTQKERLEELFSEMQVGFTVLKPDAQGLTHIIVDEGKGYSGYVCQFTFDQTGNMVSYACGY